MASIATAVKTVPSELRQLRTPRQPSVTSCRINVLTCRNSTCINFCNSQQFLLGRLVFPSSPHRRDLRRLPKQIAASSSGLEASITDQKGNAVTLRDAKIVIESQDENKIQVPKSFLLQILGEERVTKFVIQEIVNSTMADYVKKENIKVKENKISTTETAEELKSLFTAGKEFGFNAIIELENLETETSS
ncbi:hypothetical protein CJ030_MR3G012258 [Morella rubra]|uniref:Trigger factor ribosome-binding bacterial domain-containing protein n=1 Tax=Morella rubra TaxID=262757 RepID=A0A6A1W2L0_9ROSI|nr:hypothetical protein CJ030_MR3G012258 [Morella rubra]